MTTEHPFPLLELPDSAILAVLRRLDARSLANLELTGCSYFSALEPGRRLTIVEEVAKEAVLRRLGGSMQAAERFRRRSWRERLHLEEATGVGFDRSFSESGGFQFHFTPDSAALQSVRLVGMGPKLLMSDQSTADQPVLRWQLRVRGNTAVEFGVIPADLPPSHTALHKCLASPSHPQHRAQGFCSQITAGSLLPLKAPVMRGTLLDIVARRGHLEVVLRYPPDAKEITWQNGQPVQRPYRGPSQLRMEQDFPDGYDVRLAVTSWARAHFEVLHSGYKVDPEWAAAAAAAHADTAAAVAAAADQLPHEALAEGHLLAEDLLAPLGGEIAEAMEEGGEAEAAGLLAPAGALPVLAGGQAVMLPLAGAPAQAPQQHEHLAFAAGMGPGPPLGGGAPDAAALVVDVPEALTEHLTRPAGGPNFQLDAAALAAAAVVAAGPDPSHLAVLHQLHAASQAVLTPEQRPGAPSSDGVAGAAGAGSAVGTLYHAAAAAQAAPTSVPKQEDAAAEGGLPGSDLPSLCPSPSVELSLDGHLPSTQ